MRFIHSSDWHLGRSFYNTPLIEDQAHVLDQFVALARDEKPQVIIISGDVYDRPIPPTDAVLLLDDVLSRLILELGIPVILIAGNHDSPPRFQFGARLLEKLLLYVYGNPGQPNNFIQMYDEFGTVCVHVLPYAEPAELRKAFADDSIKCHNDAFGAWIGRVKRYHPPEARAVLVAHTFVQDGLSCESERRLTYGGAETVDATHFAGFHYAALGHLHRPQAFGHDTIQYPGSLLKYSFSEHDQTKSVNVVEMDANGRSHVERISLRPKRDVRIIEGYLEDLLKAPPDDVDRNDFVKPILLDHGAILDAMPRLREAFPNAMTLERPMFTAQPNGLIMPTNRKSNDPESLFRDFFSQVTGETLNQDELVAFSEIANQVEREEREVEV